MLRRLVPLLLLAGIQVPAQSVTLDSLLEEVVSRERLARWPELAYTCRQASSYDRDSVRSGEDSWFANWDRSQFVRVDSWWGEGDEKIFVDGEGFPSHFGTGTEDYYGYAWGRPQAFTAPFHAQPNGSGNLTGSLGQQPLPRARRDSVPLRHGAVALECDDRQLRAGDALVRKARYDQQRRTRSPRSRPRTADTAIHVMSIP